MQLEDNIQLHGLHGKQGALEQNDDEDEDRDEKRRNLGSILRRRSWDTV